MVDMGAKDCFNSVNDSYDVLGKNIAAYYPCLKSLLVIKVKRFILITLTKEVSKSPHRLSPDSFDQAYQT